MSKKTPLIGCAYGVAQVAMTALTAADVHGTRNAERFYCVKRRV